MPYTSKNKTMKRKSPSKRKTARRKPVIKKQSYKPTASFSKQMKKYNNLNAEKKIIPMLNYNNGVPSSYLGDLPCASLASAGLVTGALSALVLQTGSTLTNMNAEMNTDSGQTIAYPIGGFALTQGIGAKQLLGKYCKFTSTYINTNITMDPFVSNSGVEDGMDAMLPHQFRILQVRARRNKMVAQGAQINDIGEPSIGYNLFLNESGEPRGIISDIATQDVFTWFVNRQMWTVLKDERFTLAGNVLNRTGGDASAFAIASPVTQHKSSRFKKYWLPKSNTKVRYPFGVASGDTLEPVDFNYITHTVILCKNTSTGERPSYHWNLTCNGATAFIDE